MPQLPSAECCSAFSGQTPAQRASSSSVMANGLKKALTTTPTARMVAASECPTQPPMSGRFAAAMMEEEEEVWFDENSTLSNDDADVPSALVGHGTSARIWVTSALCAKK